MLKTIALFLGVMFTTVLAYASGTPTAQVAQNISNQAVISAYAQGVAASKENDFQKALPLFEQALRDDPSNPDVLNMLAHTQRKLGMLNEAIENYWNALKLRPNFPEAREYMAEAYIQAALQEIDTLKGYGADGKEQMEDAVENLKDAARKF